MEVGLNVKFISNAGQQGLSLGEICVFGPAYTLLLLVYSYDYPIFDIRSK